jgi:hypothetical protein
MRRLPYWRAARTLVYVRFLLRSPICFVHSMDGMTVWAHPVWELLHRLPNFAVDEAKLDAAITAMVVLCSAIPCGTCRSHVAAHFVLHPPLRVASAGALGLYVHAFHNTVRVRTGRVRAERAILARYADKSALDALDAVQRGMALAQGDNSMGVRAAAVSSVRQLLKG